jgi:hypothetical protein
MFVAIFAKSCRDLKPRGSDFPSLVLPHHEQWQKKTMRSRIVAQFLAVE